MEKLKSIRNKFKKESLEQPFEDQSPAKSKNQKISELESSFNEIMSDEFQTTLVLLENDKNKVNTTIKSLVKRMNSYRQNIERVMKKLVRLKFGEMINYCPKCGKKYENHFPRICENCSNLLFPNLKPDIKGSALPKYIVRIDSENKTILKKFFYSLAKKLEKICLESAETNVNSVVT
ncbi:MAG: hypothetical protein ACFFAN_12895 [Promethearchaeota archaeon]